MCLVLIQSRRRRLVSPPYPFVYQHNPKHQSVRRKAEGGWRRPSSELVIREKCAECLVYCRSSIANRTHSPPKSIPIMSSELTPFLLPTPTFVSLHLFFLFKFSYVYLVFTIHIYMYILLKCTILTCKCNTPLCYHYLYHKIDETT